MSRKGDAVSGAILAIIIFGVVVIVLILLYNVIFSFTKSEFTQKECQTSLLLTRSASNVNPWCMTEVPNPVPLKCSRRFVTLTDQGPDEPVPLAKYDAGCPAGAKDADGNCMPQNAIANEMAYCWETFFEGEQTLFQQMETNALPFIRMKGDATACFVCGEVTIKTRADITGFVNYTQGARYDDGTFYDYYNTRKAWCARKYKDEGACWETFAQKNNKAPIVQDTFSAGKKYAVVFMREGMATCEDPDAREFLSISYPVTQSIQVVPADEISKYCDMVIA